MDSTDQFAAQLIQDQAIVAQSLYLKCGSCAIRINSNSIMLLNNLSDYFGPFCLDDTDKVDIVVTAIHTKPPELDVKFSDWRREPGKTGRKDSYYDFVGGRLIHKVRTGMVFLQSSPHLIAAGPCLKHPNQVINFINTQYMNWLQQRHWRICHASAVVVNNRAYAIAGFSGGGKSTVMLNLLEDDRFKFLTNDRLFIRKQDDDNVVEATGIAKFPRINPGTVVNNPRLQSLIAKEEREHLLNLPKQALWQLEDKYDVDIEQRYGLDRVAGQTPLQAFFILNWQHDCQLPLTVKPVNLNNRRDLLSAIIKSPGPFYQDGRGNFISDEQIFDEQPYIETLSSVTLFEVSGQVDFEALQNAIMSKIAQEQ
jgi:HprK-related kinase B